MTTIEGKLSSLSYGDWIKERLHGNEKMHGLGVSDPGTFLCFSLTQMQITIMVLACNKEIVCNINSLV